MANPILIHRLEWFFAFVLALSAVLCVVRWNEVGCGIILMYLAVRVLLYGLLTVGV